MRICTAELVPHTDLVDWKQLLPRNCVPHGVRSLVLQDRRVLSCSLGAVLELARVRVDLHVLLSTVVVSLVGMGTPFLK